MHAFSTDLHFLIPVFPCCIRSVVAAHVGTGTNCGRATFPLEALRLPPSQAVVAKATSSPGAAPIGKASGLSSALLVDEIANLPASHNENRERHDGHQHPGGNKGSLHAQDMGKSGCTEQRDGPRKVIARAHGGVHAPNTVERCVNLDQRVLNGTER